ncbi:MAG: tRNA lysidine(34) synthetase TilS, partial [Pseudomonadota bacterium]
MSEGPISETEADRLLAKLDRFPHLAIAVSGGPDSLALLHICASWARRHGRRLPQALTVDHGLRPEARAEAEAVAGIAHRLGLRHAILTWDHGTIGSGLQTRARQARYDLMAAYCTAQGIGALLTAHHLDDQAETFLMRLKRGSGLDGLAAIPEEGHWAGLTLLRPLLDTPKARLIATAKAAALPVMLDPSNDDTKFERVRVRSNMEALAEAGLTPSAIALSARRLRRARAALDETADCFLTAHCEPSPFGYASVSRQALADTPEDIALRAISRIIGCVGGLVEPVQLAKLEDVFAALKARPDKTQTLGGCQIVPAKGSLFFFREMRAGVLPRCALQPNQPLLWDNRFRLELGAEKVGGAENSNITV